jgi:hypothetical protein
VIEHRSRDLETSGTDPDEAWCDRGLTVLIPGFFFGGSRINTRMRSTRGSGFSEAWERTEGWLFRDGLPGTGLWVKWLWEFDSNNTVGILPAPHETTSDYDGAFSWCLGLRDAVGSSRGLTALTEIDVGQPQPRDVRGSGGGGGGDDDGSSGRWQKGF